MYVPQRGQSFPHIPRGTLRRVRPDKIAAAANPIKMIDGIPIMPSHCSQLNSHQEWVAIAVAASRALVIAWAAIASLIRPERRAIQA
jgi:hypothetical protein